MTMKTRIPASPRRLAVCATLLLLAATASGCGVAMPTQPSIDSGAAVQRGAASTRIQEMGDPFEVSDTLVPGGSGEGQSPPSDGGEEVVLQPGPGNSDWGHSHKKDKN
jgi:hypothetical protein